MAHAPSLKSELSSCFTTQSSFNSQLLLHVPTVHRRSWGETVRLLAAAACRGLFVLLLGALWPRWWQHEAREHDREHEQVRRKVHALPQPPRWPEVQQLHTCNFSDAHRAAYGCISFIRPVSMMANMSRCGAKCTPRHSCHTGPQLPRWPEVQQLHAQGACQSPMPKAACRALKELLMRAEQMQRRVHP